MGISATDLGADANDAAAVVQAFVTKDVWAQAVTGDAVAQAIQTKIVQMAEVFVSAVNAADTSDAATSVSRAITMTKSLAEGLVTQAAAGKTIISSAAAQDGTVTITLVDAVVTDAIVSAVQAYTADAAITDTSLDTLASEADALKAFATDVTALLTHLTDQLNFRMLQAQRKGDHVSEALRIRPLQPGECGYWCERVGLVTYGAGDSSSSIVAAVNTLKTDLGVDSPLAAEALEVAALEVQALAVVALEVAALEVPALAVVALEVAALEVAALAAALVEAVLEQFHPSKGVLLMDRSLERQSLSMSTAITCGIQMSRVVPLISAGFIR